MRTLTVGILAHVDAGKTTLTERLLQVAGVIDEVGSVDDGTTRTDTLAQERRRGITIKAAVATFRHAGVVVNLVDTPGHPDFIAEVERALEVLDGVVLVVSAVEGVQAQTIVLARTLRRLGVPTVVFANKMDRTGADALRVGRELEERLGMTIVPMTSVADRLDPDAARRLVEVLAEHDDALLAEYVDDAVTTPYPALRASLAEQTAAAQVHPLVAGSAGTGAGVDALLAAMVELLPVRHGDDQAAMSGRVFKVERDLEGRRTALVRMYAGRLRCREQVTVRSPAPHGPVRRQRVSSIAVFDGGTETPVTSLAAGRIARVRGLGDVEVGGWVGARGRSSFEAFDPPTLETRVVSRPGDAAALHVALTRLAEQDPLINLRTDPVRRETFVSLYGEVQKEVVHDALAEDYGIDVTFEASTPVCVERPLGTGAAVEEMPRGRSADHPFLAGVGVSIAPGLPGTGVCVQLGVERGSLPRAFLAAIEETVPLALRAGLRGWGVTDCVVTIDHTGYSPRQSKPHAVFDKAVSTIADDFRSLTPLVLMTALQRAGTVVCEPIHSYRLEVPSDTLGPVTALLATLVAAPVGTTPSRTVTVCEGYVAAATLHQLQRRLPAVTRGEAVLEHLFARYDPVRGEPPRRRRTDADPLDRKAYLLHVARRT